MNNYILKEIHSCIIEISDLQLQRKIWLNENNDTGLVSSYVELMCMLFDNFEFRKFVNYRAKEYGISDDVIIELKKLKVMLDNYKEKATYIEIIEDEEWNLISLQAKIIVNKWKIN
jgi:GDP-D-mannose dehydratase